MLGLGLMSDIVELTHGFAEIVLEYEMDIVSQGRVVDK
jgi:hypothetical protein